MPVFATVGIFKPVLALPVQSAMGVATHPQPHLVHALVEPLHTRMLAGALAVERGVFGRGAAGIPERDGGDQRKKDKQGKTHAYSVGLHRSWLKSARGRFFLPQLVKIGKAGPGPGLVFSQEGER